MIFIIDRKRKQKCIEWNEPDPMGIGQAQRNRANELPVSEENDNPIDKWLLENPNPKTLIGKTAYVLKDNKESLVGRIVDIYPSRFLLVRCHDGQNRPIEFEKVISLSRK